MTRKRTDSASAHRGLDCLSRGRKCDEPDDNTPVRTHAWLNSALATVLITALSVATGLGPASATPPARPAGTVMTYNVYLGANLQPLFGEDNPIRLIEKAAGIVARFDKVDFRVRAVAIAQQIIEQDPDVLALQEVSLLETAPPPRPPQFTTKYDFLQILLDELERQGHPFRAVSVNPNFTGTLPIDFVGTLARFTDRNVIIVPRDVPASELTTSNPAQDVYDRTLDVPIGGMIFTVSAGGRASMSCSTAPVPLLRHALRGVRPRGAEGPGGRACPDHVGLTDPVVLAGDINLFPKGVRALDDAAWGC